MRLSLRTPRTTLSVLEYLCTGRIARYMYARGWSAVTLPIPGLTVILYWTAVKPRTRVHEWVHVAQIERMGSLVFLWAYLREMGRGYRGNRYEVEAYATEKEPVPEWARY